MITPGSDEITARGRRIGFTMNETVYTATQVESSSTNEWLVRTFLVRGDFQLVRNFIGLQPDDYWHWNNRHHWLTGVIMAERADSSIWEALYGTRTTNSRAARTDITPREVIDLSEWTRIPVEAVEPSSASSEEENSAQIQNIRDISIPNRTISGWGGCVQLPG